MSWEGFFLSREHSQLTPAWQQRLAATTQHGKAKPFSLPDG
jgi:hypothetical protein